MKKNLIALGLALAALLCACGKNAPAYTVQDAQALLDAGVFTGEMENVDSEVAVLLYGLDPETVGEAVCYMAIDTSVSADELAVLVLESESAAEKAQAACEKRIEKQIESCRDYCPAAVPNLEDAVVLRRGSTVLLAVGEGQALAAALEELGLS